ncbi:MAG: S46 family peptidase [Verrucomicrobia bacterium]|nr:S46 family peptidase [Verrucomicrobiota bacterium]
MKSVSCAGLCGLLFLLSIITTAQADEGFWLFNAPPLDQLKSKYDFSPDAAWLEHLQKSSVRFNNGGSGSFVSPTGLVITNHHVGADALEKFSGSEHNYLRDGFYAATFAEEKKCYDLELNVLESIEDVTDRVNAAFPQGATSEQTLAARRKAIADIEQESKKTTGLRSDVVTLFEGASYQLYRYKQYTDVRLVFAPEAGIAFFGGDPDNFEYPRYNLDMCLFRVYENGRPVHPEHYLRFSPDGPSEHELTFVSGNPGFTDRLATTAAIEEHRDIWLPILLSAFYRKEVLLDAYSARSSDNARKAREELLRVQNTRKALAGQLAGLLDPQTFQLVSARQDSLEKEAAKDPRFSGLTDSYTQIQKAIETSRGDFVNYLFYEGLIPRSSLVLGIRNRPLGFDSQLFRFARGLVRAAVEQKKENEKRLPEYRETSRETLELLLFSEAPIYDDLEIQQLSGSLTNLVTRYGVNDPLVKDLLQGKSPHDRAYELISGTHLKDVQFRRKLYQGGLPALNETNDPMIKFAQATDEMARRARQAVEEQNEVCQTAYAQIAKAKRAIQGNHFAPDATFSLRLSFGTTEGYEEDGKSIPAFTDFAGLYERAAQHDNQSPFDLPKRWLDRRSALNPHTPFNFVSTADNTGGNSGSPVVNRKGEFVGILFDGNIQSLPTDYLYTDKQARAVAVDSRAILEALDKVYQIPALVAELTGKSVN